MMTREELDRELYGVGRVLTSGRSVVPAVMAEVASLPLSERTTGRAMRWSTHIRQLPRMAISAAAACSLLLVVALLMLREPTAFAFADQALAAFDNAASRGVTMVERTEFILSDGTRHVSSTWDVLFVGRNAYRRDIYDDDHKREIQWYTPDETGMRQTSVQLNDKTFSIDELTGGFGVEDPAERVRFLVHFVDKADRELPEKIIDGYKCRGFEIHANKYGDNPSSWVDRIWFDVSTKLPVRIEKERPHSGNRLKALTTVQERFNWKPNLPADTFTPKVPVGYSRK